jgi:hypothetical protein
MARLLALYARRLAVPAADSHGIFRSMLRSFSRKA